MKKIIAVLFFMTAALIFGCNVDAEAAEKNDVLQWGDWSYILVNNEAYVCGYNGTDREITIPSEIEGKKVTAICSRLEGIMFKRFFTAEEPQTVSVTVPEGVTELRRRCFGNCKILEQVTLPSTLERIGEDAFCYCPNLTEVNIPKSVKWIGDSAFKECGISSLTLPEGLEGIGEYAFERSALIEITIPNTVKYLGRQAFNECEQLASVKLSEGLVTIEACLFEKCTSLKTLTFPQGVKFVDYGVFNGCTELESVYYPKSAEEINSFVLRGEELPNLKDIYFEGTESRFIEITGSTDFYKVEGQPVTYHYNYPLPSKEAGFSPEPLSIVFMVISAVMLCALIVTLIICIKLKKLKTPPKYNNTTFAPDVLGSWECEKCGTVNGSIGRYCYKCGKRRK